MTSAEDAAALHASVVSGVLGGAAVRHLVYGEVDGYERVVAVEQGDAERALVVLEDADAELRVAVGASADEPLSADRHLPVLRSHRSLGIHRRLDADLEAVGFGRGLACRLDLWDRRDGYLRAPRATPWGRFFPTQVMDPAAGTWPPGPAGRRADLVDFPIDAVYTWVDGSDPSWAARRQAALSGEGGAPAVHRGALSAFRFRNRDELRYSLRSLACYAPFVRRVYLVTDDQVPSWLDTSSGRIEVVSHRDIFTADACHPTFNSRVIEGHLHRIPGLSEHFLYLNDDCFFGRPVRAELFFHPNGVTRHFRSSAPIPPGPASPRDVGLDSPAKNGRDLIEREFDRRITAKFRHVPHAQSRSLTEAVVATYPSEIARSMRNPFRHPTDVSVPSALVHHHGYLTGRSIDGRIRYEYIGLGDVERTARRFTEMLGTRDRDVFCINDDEVPDHQEDHVTDLVRDFLERYYPVRGPFERS